MAEGEIPAIIIEKPLRVKRVDLCASRIKRNRGISVVESMQRVRIGIRESKPGVLPCIKHKHTNNRIRASSASKGLLKLMEQWIGKKDLGTIGNPEPWDQIERRWLDCNRNLYPRLA